MQALIEAIEATESHLRVLGFDPATLLGAKGFVRIKGLADAVEVVYSSDEAKRSREMLNSIKARLAELDRFWEKEQTKGEVEAFILDEVFIKLPSPPFTPEEKKLVADNVYAHVWQQAMSGGFSKAA